MKTPAELAQHLERRGQAGHPVRLAPESARTAARALREMIDPSAGILKGELDPLDRATFFSVGLWEGSRYIETLTISKDLDLIVAAFERACEKHLDHTVILRHFGRVMLKRLPGGPVERC